jgi:GntR family transcriptional regulator, galactonate operon transcriptional repressor
MTAAANIPDIGSHRPRTLQDRVLERLGRDIVRGRYAEGVFLPTEADLAREFSVGRSTLREVVRVLVSKGMLEVQTRTGTRVRPRSEWRKLDRDVVGWTFAEGPDPALLRDLIEVRRIVEPEAADLAARRAGAADLLQLERAYRAMEAALPHDLTACVAADVAFHTALLNATGNVVLKEFETMVEAALGAAFQLSTMSVQSYSRTLAAHWAVYDAVRCRAPTVAREAMLDLLSIAQEDIRSSTGQRA